MEKTKNIVDYRSFHSVVVKPFTEKELKERENKSGVITEKVTVSLSKLIKFDRYGLFDHVCKLITGSELGLRAITYKVAGRTTDDEVIIKVTGILNYSELK